MIISKLEWIGLVHGRGFARNEVGLAIINLTACELHLCQMTDSHGFVKTLTKMNLFRPTEVNKTNNIAGEMSPFSSLSLTHTHTHKTRRQWGQNLTPLFTSFFSISSVSSLFIYFFITIDFLFFFLSSSSSCSLTGRDTHTTLVVPHIDPKAQLFLFQ